MIVQRTACLVHELVASTAAAFGDSAALTYAGHTLDYRSLYGHIQNFAAGLGKLRLQRTERVGIYLEKRAEAVIAIFGTAAAGCVFVPVNPLLKSEQVAYILRNCNVRVLVTSATRLGTIAGALNRC